MNVDADVLIPYSRRFLKWLGRTYFELPIARFETTDSYRKRLVALVQLSSIYKIEDLPEPKFWFSWLRHFSNYKPFKLNLKLGEIKKLELQVPEDEDGFMP